MSVLTVCTFLTETDKDSRRTLTASGSLILNDVNFGDTAIYQCQASNKHGTILTNTHVYVAGECLVVHMSLKHSFVYVSLCVPHVLCFLRCFRAASTDPY